MCLCGVYRTYSFAQKGGICVRKLIYTARCKGFSKNLLEMWAEARSLWAAGGTVPLMWCRLETSRRMDTPLVAQRDHVNIKHACTTEGG